jgi:ADP-heptose:LPS heptosyltransferase
MLNKILKPLELALRNIIVYPLMRMLLGNTPHTGIINLKQAKKLLIFRQDRIGDMIISTPIFSKLKREYPDLHLSVLASPTNASVVENDPNIDQLVVEETGLLRKIKQILWLRRQKYDILLNFIFNKTTSIGVLARIICPKGIKVSQGPEKYKFYFNHFLTLERGKKHTGELYVELVEKVFGLHFNRNEYIYELHIPERISAAVNIFLENMKTPIPQNGKTHNEYILLNISATDPEKSFSARQSEEIAFYLSQSRRIPTIIISGPWDNKIRQRIIEKTHSPYCISFPENGKAELLAIAEITNRAAFVVTPDTSIIHFASAMNTPVIGVYTPLQYTEEWYPYEVDHIMLMAENGKPVSDIPVELILSEIDNYIGKYLPV